jgi:ACS family hexuronate transporter-like MFS transporter
VFYENRRAKAPGAAELAYINRRRAARRADGKPAPAVASWFELLGYRQTWAFALRQIHDRRRLVVLPVLAAQIPVRAIRHDRHRHPVPLAVLYSMTMIGSIGGGWFPTYFINKRRTPTTAA